MPGWGLKQSKCEGILVPLTQPGEGRLLPKPCPLCTGPGRICLEEQVAAVSRKEAQPRRGIHTCREGRDGQGQPPGKARGRSPSHERMHSGDDLENQLKPSRWCLSGLGNGRSGSQTRAVNAACPHGALTLRFRFCLWGPATRRALAWSVPSLGFLPSSLSFRNGP